MAPAPPLHGSTPIVLNEMLGDPRDGRWAWFDVVERDPGATSPRNRPIAHRLESIFWSLPRERSSMVIGRLYRDPVAVLNRERGMSRARRRGRPLRPNPSGVSAGAD